MSANRTGQGARQIGQARPLIAEEVYMGRPERSEKQNVSEAPQAGVYTFGGCARLRDQYALIGTSLLRYDGGFCRYRHGISDEFSDFCSSVATVPVEVLESYLEDLLNLEVSEQSLSIFRRKLDTLGYWIALAGLLASLAMGLFAVSTGASPILGFGLTVALSLPFGILWHYAPRSGLVRRLGFAQIVSHAVARRRGTDDSDTRPRTSAMVITELLARAKSQTPLQGAARVVYH